MTYVAPGVSMYGDAATVAIAVPLRLTTYCTDGVDAMGHDSETCPPHNPVAYNAEGAVIGVVVIEVFAVTVEAYGADNVRANDCGDGGVIVVVPAVATVPIP